MPSRHSRSRSSLSRRAPPRHPPQVSAKGPAIRQGPGDGQAAQQPQRSTDRADRVVEGRAVGHQRQGSVGGSAPGREDDRGRQDGDQPTAQGQGRARLHGRSRTDRDRCVRRRRRARTPQGCQPQAGARERQEPERQGLAATGEGDRVQPALCQQGQGQSGQEQQHDPPPAGAIHAEPNGSARRRSRLRIGIRRRQTTGAGVGRPGLADGRGRTVGHTGRNRYEWIPFGRARGAVRRVTQAPGEPRQAQLGQPRPGQRQEHQADEAGQREVQQQLGAVGQAAQPPADAGQAQAEAQPGGQAAVGPARRWPFRRQAHADGSGLTSARAMMRKGRSARGGKRSLSASTQLKSRKPRRTGLSGDPRLGSSFSA